MEHSLADRLKSLGHPARLEILRVLAARGTCVCGEVVEVMPLAQATISQHLKVLKEAGLIRGRIEGKNSCYCLDPRGIADLRDALDDFLGGLSDAAWSTREPEKRCKNEERGRDQDARAGALWRDRT
jgi:DNA-binding transcriptional ArsR family regulator